jgi:hypothetical protein
MARLMPATGATSAAMSPFDGSSLQIIDRAASWSAAREDFLFESALVGFGMLLKGAPDLGQLNHDLVHRLAERSLGDDRSGERARFLKVLRQAQQSAGLQ